jgi:hypothetical protein
MLWPRIALGLYFTGALGIAGIAKLEYPKQFAAAPSARPPPTVEYHRLQSPLPVWEILLVCLLALVTPLISATAVVVGFLCSSLRGQSAHHEGVGHAAASVTR